MVEIPIRISENSNDTGIKIGIGMLEKLSGTPRE